MMCDFKPGDEIVCVSGPFRIEGRSYPANIVQPVIGLTYKVRAIGVRHGFPGVLLEEIAWRTNDGDEGFYASSRFRKVQKRNSSLSIESFLTIKPGQFEEPRRETAKPKKEKVK